jgi:CubicO group peptidase (beta-lactamase class C family)
MNTLSRRTLIAAAGALTASRVRTAYAQEIPFPNPDWQVVDPATVGLSQEQLTAAGDYAAANMPDITGIVVVRQNGLAYERYFGESYGRDDPVNIRSITKSITGTLVGMAIGDGLFALDTPIGDIIPHLIPAGADPLTPSITIEHLLTMSAGWGWDIGSDWQTLIASENWTELTLGLPVVYEPGTVYAYNTGGSHLLGVIAQHAAGEPLEDFADRRLWTPLGIDRPEWMRSPQGDISGGSGLELTPLDLTRFGLLSLRDGQWNGEALVQPGWFPEATRFHLQGDSTGYAGYGYQWWIVDYENGFHAYFGLGFGSNYLYVVPSLDLVVVVLKGFTTPPSPVSIVRPFIEGWIVPAVVG